jgi:uncharacterized membrane protein YeaQ/YmgE (transglycosylase-associated protein family)
MELVYVTVIGAAIGLLARYVLPGRRWYGILLLPAAAAAVTATVWAALVWAGWKFDGGWIWVVSLAAAVVTSVLIPLLLPRYREAHDAQLMHHLSAGKA